MVYSPKAARREEGTLQRWVEKEGKAAQKAWRRLRAQGFNCREDTQEALATFQKKWKYHYAEAEVMPVMRYPGCGRPSKGAVRQVVGYRLQGEVVVREMRWKVPGGHWGVSCWPPIEACASDHTPTPRPACPKLLFVPPLRCGMWDYKEGVRCVVPLS